MLPEPSAAEPGTLIGRAGETALFYGGPARIEAHPLETQYYRDTTSCPARRASGWCCVRSRERLPEIVKVTCDPTEGEGFTETGWDTVNMVPMPEAIEAALAAFIDAHHVDDPFVKRKRDRQDPEALAAGRRGPDRDRFPARAAEEGGRPWVGLRTRPQPRRLPLPLVAPEAGTPAAGRRHARPAAGRSSAPGRSRRARRRRSRPRRNASPRPCPLWTTSCPART